MEFENKVVVVTGAAQGIGKEIALGFAKQKATVIIFDLNEEALKETQKELNVYTDCSYYLVNVTNTSEVEETVNKIIDKFTKIDILVNNAGITKDNLVLRLSDDDWDKVIAVNLRGSFICSRICAKKMVKQRKGKIINISSIIGIIGNAGQSNYAASKAGLIGLTKSMAKELG
ncbi:MAG: SDR family NAD(P)-dependent oxidoreductase, partial [Candidatus Omnitrophica bacterium]|nr:SDR family NAD(P)-dependent oxidoreductase [Candidatus Omnitrophota bacterium]